MAATLDELVAHPTAGPPTELMLERFGALFGSRAGSGIAMAAEAMRGAMPEDRVRAICMAFSEAMYDSLEWKVS